MAPFPLAPGARMMSCRTKSKPAILRTGKEQLTSRLFNIYLATNPTHALPIPWVFLFCFVLIYSNKAIKIHHFHNIYFVLLGFTWVNDLEYFLYKQECTSANQQAELEDWKTPSIQRHMCSKHFVCMNPHCWSKT